jgi:hypothetical protein
VSYHAPAGVSRGIIKPRQAVTVARWLADQQGPVLRGANANTWLIDAADFVKEAGTGTKPRVPGGAQRVAGDGKWHCLRRIVESGGRCVTCKVV